MFRQMLATEEDISFHYCQDPTRAIATANAIAPTVILQDLVMPEMDGLTLVRFMRANAATREVPLIVLSSKGMPILIEALRKNEDRVDLLDDQQEAA
jgi:PleD family two-component response regulator